MTEQRDTATLLEQRYRRLLRLLPDEYRAAWQEEMVTTFLASMHTDDADQAEYLADYGRPSLSEAASVVALAIRLRLPGWRRRLGGAGAAPRDVVLGDAVRLVALIGMLNHAASTGGVLVTELWLAGRAPWLAPAPPEAAYVMHTTWFRFATIASVIWLPAYLALLLGPRRTSLILGLLALGLSDVAVVLNHIQPFTVSQAAYLVFNALPVLALAAFHRDAPPPRRRPWLIALPVAIAVTVGFLVLTVPDDPRTFPLLDFPAACCVAWFAVAAGHLGWRRRATASWSLALVLLAPAVLGLRALTLVDDVANVAVAQRSTLVALGVAEAAAVLVLAVPLAALTIRMLRRLPAPA